MWKVIVIVCLVIVAYLCGIALKEYSHWLQQKVDITNQLEAQMRSHGVTSPVEIRKSKFDVDDWKLKIWFRVPKESRIVDVFGCDGIFQYEVLDNGKHKTMTSDQAEDFLRHGTDAVITNQVEEGDVAKPQAAGE